MTDPESCIMKDGHGGYRPAFNVQLNTDAEHQIIVGVGVSQSGSDYGELADGLNRVRETTGKFPEQVVVDGGYVSRDNVKMCADQGVEMIGPSPVEDRPQSAGQMKRRGVAEEFFPQAFAYDPNRNCYRCPAGCELPFESNEREANGLMRHKYRAAAENCAGCAFKEKCCPQNYSRGRSLVRTEETPTMTASKEKMKTEEAKAFYRKRGAVAEFPNAWLKEKIGLRQFHVRGLVKVEMETIWACLTFNIIQQWVRLIWRTQPVMAGP